MQTRFKSNFATTLGMALLVISGFICSGCRKGAEPKAAGGPGKGGAAVPVLVTQAVVKPMPIEISGFGNVEPYSKVAIRSRISGELTAVHFKEGQEVKRGELLFTIDPRPIRAALAQAEANHLRDEAQTENARLEFERQKKLLESALIPRDEYDKADANLKALRAAVLADRAALTNAALNLEFTSITSPIDGRTGNLLVHAGNVVQAGSDILVNINQIRPVYVAFSVPERHFAEVTRQMSRAKLPVEAKLPRSDDSRPRGELSFLDNVIDPTTGMIELKATFPNEDAALWPGQFVQVLLRLREQPDALVLPAQAVQNGQTNEFVFVVKADQTVELRPVKAGWSRNGETVIQAGVQQGETVVTDGQLRLVPGSKVLVKPGLMPAAGVAANEASRRL